MAISELDVQLAAFNQKRAAATAQYPDPYKSPLDVARRSIEAAQGTLATGGPRMARTEERWLVIPGRRILVRLHYPTESAGLPALIFLHGGGWVWNSIDTHDRVAREYAVRANVVVIAPDYSLAPEYPFPTALNECVAVVRGLRDAAGSLHLDGDRIAIGGDSAGANIALAAALALRDAGDPPLRGALLNYPPLDPTLQSASYQTFSAQLGRMAWYWGQYLQRPVDRQHPYAAPLLAALAGLPPLRIQVGDLDALVDENIELARLAGQAGVDTELAVYPGMTHAFLRAVGEIDRASEAVQAASDWLIRVLA